LTTITERVPVDAITLRARQASPGRTALLVVAGLLFGVGWLAFKTFAVAWLAVAWCASAVIEGWQEARKAEAVRRARAGRTGPR
jgi:hypothetical protein